MTSKLLQAFMAAAVLAGPAASLLGESVAYAQAGATVGSVRGQIKDKGAPGGGPAAGATVVATSTSLQGDQVVLADDQGLYFLTSLPPGSYTLTIYYADRTFERKNVFVGVGKEAVVNVTVDSSVKQAGLGKEGKGEIIEIQGTAPIIDQGSTKTGLTITDDYTRNIPTGRTFGGVIGQAAGSQGDIYGTSIGGATSSENTYIVEGINTTDTGFGGLSSNLPNEFIQETEVITGGYNAEYGRATGGIINVVTKSGTNEFHGSVFGYVRPGAFISKANEVKEEGGSIDSATDLNYNFDAGAEVGGPIIKDKLWFHIGINPSFTKDTTSRIVRSLVDNEDNGPGMDRGDGTPDVDENGLSLHDDSNAVTTAKIPSNYKTYYFTAKINGAVNADNQFQISAFGNPNTADAVYGITRNPQQSRWKYDNGAYDVSGKWTSKLNGGKTQIDAVVGYHYGFQNEDPYSKADNLSVIAYNYERSLYDFSDLENTSIASACDDMSVDDKYKKITNCPVTGYTEQGLGFLEHRTNDRKSALLTVTQRVKLLGYHTFKAGAEGEFSGYDAHRGYTGGHNYLRLAADTATVQGRWRDQTAIAVERNLTPEERAALNDDDDMNDPAVGVDEVLCAMAPGSGGDPATAHAICKNIDTINANTTSRSLAGFIQDEWQIRPNFSINLGLRYEQQVGYAAKEQVGKVQNTGEVIGDRAFTLNNNLAPRLGFIFDPTSEGKGKIFGHYGRFYENVPMDINVRAFGGETFNDSRVNLSRLEPSDAGYDPNCLVDHMANNTAGLNTALDKCTDRGSVQLLSDGPAYITKGLQAQYTQEFILGTEFEIRNDLKVGLNYIHRSLPTVIEDISTDGGTSYVITNPGDNFDAEANDLDKLSKQTLSDGGCMDLDGAGAACDPEKLALAQSQHFRAGQLRFVKTYDKPVRNYDAIQLTATQRPTKNSLLIASYTYSVSKGNYPGLFSTETGQSDPNITSLYDLPDLMANRYGKLGLDRPHNLKVDGFYMFDLKKSGTVTVGASVRAISGIAHNALAAHPIYGGGESYLLPRGSIERSPISSQTDVHLAYGYNINKTTKVEGFVNFFNLFNQQDELNVDEVYTVDSANPIVNGTQSDLAHLKALDPDGFETSKSPVKNKNFNNTGVSSALLGNPLQAPRNVQLGFRVTF